MISIEGTIAQYKFESFELAIKRLNSWIEQGLATEKDLCFFIMQLFHEIPEDVYNDLINNRF